METNDLNNLSEEELLNLYQKNDISLAQFFQASIDYKNEYLDYCKKESRHKDDNEAAIAFLDYTIKLVEAEIDGDNF